ncbi:winged helix-turn-helix transcriptional regulator [Chthonobacter albigriseus]|uniref:winged helix-turn-helix transcriptional regulator n=1 Tax=Chthonobacter albigriseus TaxID=1683161 RepID=UPI0015EFAC4E|nr:winged helix-turn-helix domain-containing protein [Chthonobacter albigriseus]
MEASVAMQKILILSDDPKYTSLCPLLRARGADAEVGSAAQPRADGQAYDLAIVAPGEIDSAEQMVNAITTRDRCHTMVVLPDADEAAVNRLYSAGAAVVFPQPVDPFHLFLQCRYFLELEQGQRRTVSFGDVRLDEDRKTLFLGDRREIAFTEVEAKILGVLMSRPGRFVAKELISESVFGKAYDKFDRRIDVHISNIRRKLRASETDLTILTSRLGGLKIAPEAADLPVPDRLRESLRVAALS